MQPAATGRLAPWDRAFELTSVVPLGAFAVIHTLDYSRALFGAAEIGARRQPSLPALVAEAFFVWLPLAGHTLYSIVVWRRRRKAEAGSASLLAHRIAGIAVGLFLVDHFLRFRLPILTGSAYPSDSVVRLAAELSSTRAGVPWVAALHLFGVIALAFHLSLGLRRIVDRSASLRASPLAQASCVGAGVVAGLLGVLTILRLAAGA